MAQFQNADTDSTGLGLRISKRNLKDFMASIFQGRRQESRPLR